MSKVPTAEEVIDKIVKFTSVNDTINCTVYSLSQVMVDFAKLHVEAALKEASEKARVQMSEDYVVSYIKLHPNSLVDTVVITANAASILNSYSLDNIK